MGRQDAQGQQRVSELNAGRDLEPHTEPLVLALWALWVWLGGRVPTTQWLSQTHQAWGWALEQPLFSCLVPPPPGSQGTGCSQKWGGCALAPEWRVRDLETSPQTF